MPLLCIGAADGTRCRFAPGARKKQVHGKGQRCIFCDPCKLSDALLHNKTRKPAMFAFKRLGPRYQAIVIERAPEDVKRALGAVSARQRLCEGRAGQLCVFSSTGERVPVRGTHDRCMYCGPVENLVKLLETRRGSLLIQKSLREMPPASRELALEDRVPAAYQALLSPEPVCAGTSASAKKRRLEGDRTHELTNENGMEAWAPVLRGRGVSWSLTPTEGRAYRKRKLEDAARARRTFGRRTSRRVERGQEIGNECPLLTANHYSLARKFQLWAKYNSWQVCEQCGVKQVRSLDHQGLKRILPPVIPREKAKRHCVNCRAVRRFNIPAVSDQPSALQGLDAAAMSALAVIEVDTGPETRALGGYRVHGGMMRFRWKATSVRSRVEDLSEKRMRRRARDALTYLLSAESTQRSQWRHFYDEHLAFLQKHGPYAEERHRMRWCRFIEAEGLECAIWPTIFYDKTLCFTVERLTNPGRKDVGRQSWEAFASGQPDVFDEMDAAEGGDTIDGQAVGMGRNSIKRLFMQIAMAPDLSFGAFYDVLHFAYDLHLWTLIGAKRNLQCGTTLRQMLAGESFSPLFWRRSHLALLDIVRQRGCPPLFLTIAPYEWSMPYHVSVLDEMEKMGRGRQRHPLHETLHMTHVMTQAVIGLLCGSTVEFHGAQRSNELQIIPAFGEDEQPVDVYPVMRVEFQDGTRKDPSQDYHGSGRPHVHAVVFGTNPKDWKLHEWARADVPGSREGMLRELVLGAQINKMNRFGVRETEWPVHEGESRFNEKTGTYELHHSHAHKQKGIRAYVSVLMEALSGCHQDLQYSADHNIMALYIAKYIPKFSDSFTEEFLKDDAGLSGDATAAGILCRYHPMEPEMVLQLFAQQMPQWKISSDGGGAGDFFVPWPEQEDMPKYVVAALEAYKACEWRGEGMSLLEYLRKTDSKYSGVIVQWVRRKHSQMVAQEGYELYKRTCKRPRSFTHWRQEMTKKKKQDKDHADMGWREYFREVEGLPVTVPDIEAFAREYQCKGEKAVCCAMRSRLSDEFYGQWMVLHVPFRDIRELVPAGIDAVPKAYRNMAIAMCSKHPIAQEMWDGLNPERLETEMMLEGHRKRYRTSVANYVSAHRRLVKNYVAGRLRMVDEVGGHIKDGLIRPKRVNVAREIRLPIKREFAEMIPHAKDVEGRVDMGTAATVFAGDVLLLGGARSKVLRVHRYSNFEAMLSDLGFKRAVPQAQTLEAAVAVYHGFRNYEAKAAERGVVAYELGYDADGHESTAAVRLQPMQRRAVDLAIEQIDNAISYSQRELVEGDRDAMEEDAWNCNKIQVIDGPPGTGKSFVQGLLIKETLRKGGSVLYVFLTANHASRARETYGTAVDIDTFHAALGDGSDPCVGDLLSSYALVLVDECYLLDKNLFLHLHSLYMKANKIPCLVLAGDKHQMGCPGGFPCFMTNQWKRCTVTTRLVYDSEYTQRTSDRKFIELLNKLRLRIPRQRGGKYSVAQIVRFHKAWKGNEPTVGSVRDLYKRLQKTGKTTTVLAVSRVAVHKFNELAVAAFFTDEDYLGCVDGDVESNPDNYNTCTKEMLPHGRLRPTKLRLYRGMRVTITRNVNKRIGYNNGAQCTVEEYDPVSGGVLLLSNSGGRIMSYRWTDKDLGDCCYHPIRSGYCSTIIKYQGAELDHVTVWLDTPGVGAAAYTALSRVKRACDYLIGGKVGPEHFVPACVSWMRRLGLRAFGKGTAGSVLKGGRRVPR